MACWSIADTDRLDKAASDGDGDGDGDVLVEGEANDADEGGGEANEDDEEGADASRP